MDGKTALMMVRSHFDSQSDREHNDYCKLPIDCVERRRAAYIRIRVLNDVVAYLNREIESFGK